jgi:hypothetical protein
MAVMATPLRSVETNLFGVVNLTRAVLEAAGITGRKYSVKRQKTQSAEGLADILRPQNTAVLSGGLRLDVASTHLSIDFACRLRNCATL